MTILRLTLEPEEGENVSALGSSAHISPVELDNMLRLVGANFDTTSPKQARDPSTRELLYLDASNNTVTETEMAALVRASADPRLPPSVQDRPVFTAKYEPRTPQEVWTKIAAQATKALLDLYVKLANDEAERQRVLATRPTVVPVFPPTVI